MSEVKPPTQHVEKSTSPSIADAVERVERLRRRQLLTQTAAIGGISALAGWSALAPPGWPLSLRDPDGELGKPKSPVLRLPPGGFALEPDSTRPELSIAHGKQPAQLLRAAVQGLGGMRRFVQKDDVVLLKPNVAFERSAPLGATTHPELLAEMIRLVRQAGAKEVRVCDNPIESPQACFARSGLQDAAIQAGARVFLPRPASFAELNTPGATLIEQWPFFYEPFVGVTKVIGLAPVKDHNLCGASMTTKNWYGLLGGRRNQFHQNIHEIIADLALMLKPSLVILDGIRVLFRSGPTGGSLSDVRAGHTVVASVDSLAADSYGFQKLLQRRVEDLPDYFRRCEARGLGTADWQSLRVKEQELG